MNVKDLTLREVQVALQIIDGLTVKESAKKLKINFETVRFHMRKLRHSLGMRRKSQIAVWTSANQGKLRKRLHDLSKSKKWK